MKRLETEDSSHNRLSVSVGNSDSKAVIRIIQADGTEARMELDAGTVYWLTEALENVYNVLVYP